MIWFTSDQHFGHFNVIKYCNRPFDGLEHMAEELIRRHNERVKSDDEVWHLGDFSLHPRQLAVLSRLNGTHHLRMGNHDGCHPIQCKSPEKLTRIRK